MDLFGGDLEATEFHYALHHLWTKAVGTDGYVKGEWQALEKQFHTLRFGPNGRRPKAPIPPLIPAGSPHESRDFERGKDRCRNDSLALLEQLGHNDAAKELEAEFIKRDKPTLRTFSAYDVIVHFQGFSNSDKQKEVICYNRSDDDAIMIVSGLTVAGCEGYPALFVTDPKKGEPE